jgi:3-hydroxybutyryl-CoA dehydrogenase
MANRTQSIYITGDSPLVEEYAAALKTAGANVSVRPNLETPLPHPGVHRTPATRRRTTVRSPKQTSLALELTVLSPVEKRQNLEMLSRTLGPAIPIITASVTTTTTRQSGWVTHPERVVGIGAFPSLLRGALIELAPSPVTDRRTLDSAGGLVKLLGKESARVGDAVGLVMPRILCTLANEAFFALSDQLASPTDIDTAMKLGTNYPLGPIEWAGNIGYRFIVAVLSALHEELGDERYRISPLLRRAAELGRIPVPATRPDNPARMGAGS